MSELANIFRQAHPLPIDKISQWFREKDIDLLFSDLSEFYDELFATFAQTPTNYTKKEWEHILLIACIFTIATNPPHSLISIRFPKDSQNGYYIVSSLILMFRKQHSTSYVDQLFKFYQEHFEKLFPIEPTSSFYEITTSFYFLDLPQLLGDSLFKSPYAETFPQLFKKVSELQMSQINYSTILFISKIFDYIEATIISTSRPILISNEFISALARLIDLSPKSPSIFLLLFFEFWVYITQNLKEFIDVNPLIEKLPIIVDLFEYVSMTKYHELHSSFPWYVCLYFIEEIPDEEIILKRKLLTFICNGIRYLDRMDHYLRITESIRWLSSYLLTLFYNNQPYLLFYYLTSLNSSFGALSYDLLKIHGAFRTSPNNYENQINHFFSSTSSDSNRCINLINPKNEKRKKEKYIEKVLSFYDQCGIHSDLPFFDNYLYTKTFERVYDNDDECAKDFDYILSVCEKIRKRLHSLVIFHSQICLQVITSQQTQEIQPNQNFANLNNYLLQGYHTMIDFLILASHKQTELQTFSNHPSLTKANVSSNHIQYIQSPQNLLNVNNIFQEYFVQCISQMPESFIQILAQMVANSMLKYIKKGLISYHFLINFIDVHAEHKSANSFLHVIITKMLEIVTSKLSLLLSSNISDVKLLASWIAFIIKLATLMNKGPNKAFGVLLNTYKRTMISSVFSNLRMISHQSVAIQMLKMFWTALNDNYAITKSNRPIRFQPIQLDEIDYTALLDTLDVIFDIFLVESNFIPAESPLPFLEAAFKSENNDLIIKASKISVKLFKTDTCRQLSEYEESIFSMMVSSIHIVDRQTAEQIVSILPFYSINFLNTLQNKRNREIFTIDVATFDLLRVLQTSTERLNNSDEEANHLFALVNSSFDIILQQIKSFAGVLSPSISHLILLIKHLFGFSHLKASMQSLISNLTIVFGDLFISNVSNLYILCIFEVCGINRSQTTYKLIELAVAFFEYCKPKIANTKYISETIDNLFSFFPIPTKFFSILNAFSTIICFYPDLITLNHIRGFLIQATNVYPLDSSVTAILNEFLKRYLKSRNSETLQSFVSMVYEIICPLSMSIRIVLEKRISKLHIPLPIKNLDSILSITDSVIMFQSLTIAFLCGIDGDLTSCLNEQLIEKTKNFLKLNHDENLPRLQKYTRVLSLSFSILKNEPVLNFYLSDEEFSGILIHSISNIMILNFAPIQNQVRVCFKILKNKYQGLLLTSKLIDDLWSNPHAVFSFWGNEPSRISTYQRLAKIIPQKIPPKLILELFNEMNNYVQKSEIDQMNYLPNFLKIIKFISLKEFLMIKEVQSLILEDESIIEKYINSVITLYQHKTIPFKSLIKKYVLKFFTILPKQTIQCISFKCLNIDQINFILLGDLIIEDQSNVLFDSFIEMLENKQSIDQSVPGLYQLLEKFSSIKRFRVSNDFFRLIYHHFAIAIGPSGKLDLNENAFQILTTISKSYLNLLPFHFDKSSIFYFSVLFKNQFFNRSDVYKQFIRIAFDSLNPPEILFDLFKVVMQTISKSDNKLPINLANILIPHAVKSLQYIPLKPGKENIYVGIWDLLFKYLENPDRIPSILKSMIYMIDIYLPSDQQQLNFFKNIGKYMNSSNSQTIVYTLKLCTKFAQKLLLPKELFEGILMEIFSYDAFFKEPFYDHVLALIKSCHEYVEKLSPKTLETINFFFHNKFLQIDKFQKNLLEFVITTKIYKLLPFSYFSSICRLILTVLKKVKHEPVINKDETDEIKEILLFILPIFINSDTSENEKQFMQRTCFKFIEISILNQALLSETDKIQEIIENFFHLLEKSDHILFPKKLLVKLNQAYQGHINDSISFCLVCFGLKFDTPFTLLQFPHLIVSAIEYIQNDFRHVSVVLLNFFIKFFFDQEQQEKNSMYSMYSNYKDGIKSLLVTLFDRIDETTFDKLLLIIRIYVEAHFDSSYWKLLTKLLSIFETLSKDSLLANSFLNGFFNLTNIIPYNEQVKYINLIFKTCSSYWNSNMRNIFTKNLTQLLKSKSITNQAKTQLLELSPDYIEGTTNELFEFIESVKEYGAQSGCPVKGTIILIYILILNQGTPKTNFYCFEQVNELIGSTKNFNEKLQTLINELPIILWSDDYFFYIICLFIERIQIWYPLCAYPQKLKVVAANIAIPTFLMKMDIEFLHELRQFVTDSILKLKYTYSFTQFLTMIEYIFTNTLETYQLSFFTSIWSAVPPSFNLSSWLAEIQMEELPFEKYVYPNSFNDSLVHHFMPNTDELQYAAVFLTGLGKYEAAELLYQQQPESDNKFFKMNREFNSLFLKPRDDTFEELIKPIFKPNRPVKTVILTLEESFHAFLRGEKEESIDILKEVENQLLDDYSKHPVPSFYQKMRLIVIETLSLLLKKAVNKEDLPIFDNDHFFSSFNPSLVSLMNTFKRILLSKPPKPEVEIKGESPIVYISPSSVLNVNEVCGITSHNLYALNATQINDYLDAASKMMSNKDFSIANWMSFASFCYNIFITQQLPELFSITYFGYCQILTSKEEVDLVIRNEAGARIITMIRIATRQDVRSSFRDPIMSYSFIFKREYAKIWRFWLQELVELANSNWFFKLSVELFSEMAYRSTLYASKYTSIDMQKRLQNYIINERGSVQLSMMSTIAQILIRISSIELEEMYVQSRFKTFINESLKLSNEELDEIDLMSIREERFNITSFEKALSSLTKAEIEKIGDFKQWVNHIREMNDSERERSIQNLTNSSQPYSALYETMSSAVDDFNNQMPFIFPTPTDTITEFAVFFMHKQLTVFSPEMVSFTAATSLSSTQHFLVLGTKRPKGFSASVMSISNIFTIIRSILRHSYPTLIRKISLTNNNFFEMGPRAIMMWFGSEPTSLKNVFERDMMITQKDWIRKCIDEKTDTLNQFGLESIKQFPVDSLVKSATTSLKSYIQAYQGLAVSFAALSVIRYMLSAPYPDIGRLIISGKSLEFPILSTDFDNIDITQETRHSTFRFSPNIEHTSSIWGDCGLKTAIAAVANALTENLDLIRTHLEIIIGDQMILEKEEFAYDESLYIESVSDEFTINELVRKRTIVENRFIEISPPTRPSSIEDSTQWLTKITELVEKAKNPWIQPVTAIPWY